MTKRYELPNFVLGEARRSLAKLPVKDQKIVVAYLGHVGRISTFDKEQMHKLKYLTKLCKEQQAHIKNLEAQLLPHLIDHEDIQQEAML